MTNILRFSVGVINLIIRKLCDVITLQDTLSLNSCGESAHSARDTTKAFRSHTPTINACVITLARLGTTWALVGAILPKNEVKQSQKHCSWVFALIAAAEEQQNVISNHANPVGPNKLQLFP